MSDRRIPCYVVQQRLVLFGRFAVSDVSVAAFARLGMRLKPCSYGRVGLCRRVSQAGPGGREPPRLPEHL